MGDLQQKINEDIKQAMLSKDNVKRDTLRMLKSTISNILISKKIKELTDLDIIAIIRKAIETREVSSEAFIKGERFDLATKEQEEIQVLSVYLPSQLTAEETENLVKLAIEKVGATSRKQMGLAMKCAVELSAGRTDNSTISAVMQKLLV